MQCRDSDYPSIRTIANYMVFMYDQLKLGVDGRAIINVTKAKDYVLSFLRVALVSSQNNGYDDQADRIREVISGVENKDRKENDMGNTRNSIFISHRSTDFGIAEMIKDFLVNTGIPNDLIFCSSLPGNDVAEKIAPEVKEHLQEAAINILILTTDYYKSAYCLNEAGIAWYLDDALAIPIGLPEIDHTNMYGFLNSDYKLCRLDDDVDIAYLYDQAQKRLKTENVSHSVITQETRKLKERYTKYLSNRKTVTESSNREAELEAENTRLRKIIEDQKSDDEDIDYHNHDYIWDDEKAELVRQKHGISFKHNAVRVFDDPNAFTINQADGRKRTIGKSGRRILTVAWIQDGSYRRLITAFIAGTTDTRWYNAN